MKEFVKKRLTKFISYAAILTTLLLNSGNAYAEEPITITKEMAQAYLLNSVVYSDQLTVTLNLPITEGGSVGTYTANSTLENGTWVGNPVGKYKDSILTKDAEEYILSVMRATYNRPYISEKITFIPENTKFGNGIDVTIDFKYNNVGSSYYTPGTETYNFTFTPNITSGGNILQVAKEETGAVSVTSVDNNGATIVFTHTSTENTGRVKLRFVNTNETSIGTSIDKLKIVDAARPYVSAEGIWSGATAKAAIVWDDEEDVDGKRPTKATAILERTIGNETTEVDRKQVSKSTNWECEWKNLLTYMGSYEVKYATRFEFEDDFDSSTYKQEEVHKYDNGIEYKSALKMIHKPETIKITGIDVSFKDNDNENKCRPDAVEYEIRRMKLLAGVEYSYDEIIDKAKPTDELVFMGSVFGSGSDSRLILKDADDFSLKYDETLSLKKYFTDEYKDYNYKHVVEGGKRYRYWYYINILNMPDVPYYKVTTSLKEEGSDEVIFCISFEEKTEYTSYTGKVLWEDVNNADNYRPSSVGITFIGLNSEGKEVYEKETKVLGKSENNTWEINIKNLPKYCLTNPNADTTKEPFKYEEVSYKINEVGTVNNYGTPKINNEKKEILISRECDKINIIGKIVWSDSCNADETRPSKQKVLLYANGKADRDVEVTGPSTSSSWLFEINDLQKAENGKDIKYTLIARAIPEGYVSSEKENVITLTYSVKKTNSTSSSSTKPSDSSTKTPSTTAKVTETNKDTASPTLTTAKLSGGGGTTTGTSTSLKEEKQASQYASVSGNPYDIALFGGQSGLTRAVAAHEGTVAVTGDEKRTFDYILVALVFIGVAGFSGYKLLSSKKKE